MARQRCGYCEAAGFAVPDVCELASGGARSNIGGRSCGPLAVRPTDSGIWRRLSDPSPRGTGGAPYRSRSEGPMARSVCAASGRFESGSSSTDGAHNRRTHLTNLSRPPGVWCPDVARLSGDHLSQSTATLSAAQTAPILSLLSTPKPLDQHGHRDALDRVEVDGASSGDWVVTCSRMTSLARPRMVVVHGATRARRSRGMAASRERTTTGRRPTSGSSDHHTSPRLANPHDAPAASGND